MRKLSCRATGHDCDWEFIGDDDDEVMQRALNHDEKIHLTRPSPEEQQKMRGQIHG
jgi:predicted small metal-binding protein